MSDYQTIQQEINTAMIARIKAAIAANGGQIRFFEFMQMALYAPKLGYYQNPLLSLGAGGDFVTAPLISPLFAKCLARQCQQVMQQAEIDTLLEFGAGTGKLAADLLSHLAQNDIRPQYLILELSESLKAQQYESIQTLAPDCLSQVIWLDRLPDDAQNLIVIANEVLDAMPVHRFNYSNQQLQEYYVTCKDDQLVVVLAEPSSELIDNFQVLTEVLEPEQNYNSERSSLVQPWIKSLADIVKTGAVFLIDYGYPQLEYYHPARSNGTLTCYQQHKKHNDPLWMPGLQDITAHVDFTQVAQAAVDCGFDVSGYTTQGYFLLNCGITELAQSIDDKQAIKMLTFPQEMGELFKVMALTKNIDDELLGFSWQDLRMKL